VRRRRTAGLAAAGTAVLLLAGCVQSGGSVGQSGSSELTFEAQGDKGAQHLHVTVAKSGMNPEVSIDSVRHWKEDFGDRTAPWAGTRVTMTVTSKEPGRVRCAIGWGLLTVVPNTASGDHPSVTCTATLRRLPDPTPSGSPTR
jgi:hypothetical protein